MALWPSIRRPLGVALPCTHLLSLWRFFEKVGSGFVGTEGGVRMIRVLVADDHPLVRRGVRSVLEEQSDIEVVGEAEDGEEAVRLALEDSPDVVVIDVEMPVLDGLEATRQIHAQNPKVRVLVLTIHSEAHFVRGLLQAGASGYLLKNTYVDSLVDAVRLVNRGEVVLASSVRNIVLRALDGSGSRRFDEGRSSEFSPREMDVLRWMASGSTNSQIADRLGMSRSTIKGHVGSLMEKLGVSSRTAAVVEGIRRGLVDPGNG